MKEGFLMSFDDYAKTWDTDLRINRAKIIAGEISKVIPLNKTLSVMEFGCGTGLISFNLQDKFKQITMVDASKGMINILNSKIEQYKVNNMKARHLDITTNDTIKEKFDIIYNSMVLHHIKDTADIIKRFYNMMNKDGYLCIVDLDEEDGSFHKNELNFDGHNGFNQNDLKQLLIGAGFEEVEVHTFYYDKKRIEDESINYSLFLIKGRKR
jgi:2-polyprenyl-3-methyl-5-hydroxy-6-metoxy-1,4-benzoquinol methylase